MDNQGMDPQQKVHVDGSSSQHVQPGYPVQHGYPAQQAYGQQTGYWQQPACIVSQQPPPPDYGFPIGKIPSIILILVAIFNVLFFIILGAVSGAWFSAAFIVPMIFHGAVGGLGIAGSFTAQRSSTCAILCIIAAVISTVVAFWQVVALSITSGLIANINITWPDVIRIFVELGALICSIAMIVIPSQKVCCRQNPASGGQVIYTQNTAPAQ